MWWELQDEHQKLPRWKSYTDINPALPLQSNAAHLHGLSWQAQLLLPSLAIHPEAPKFDQHIIMQGIWVHDDPEAILRRDVNFDDKTRSDDIDELQAFIAKIGDIPARTRMIEAFLLQFIVKDNLSDFAEHLDDPTMIDRLRKELWVEGQLFNALETLDYIQYAHMCHQQCGDVVILNQVLRNQAPVLKEYGRQIGGFRDVFWTERHIESAESFMEHFHQMPKGKPEGYEWAYANGYMDRPIQFGVTVDKIGPFEGDPRGGG